MAMLKSRLYEAEMRKRQAEQDKLEAGKTDVGWGHQIRSYVLDNSRIKDLRTNVEISNTKSRARRRPRRLHQRQPETGRLSASGAASGFEAAPRRFPISAIRCASAGRSHYSHAEPRRTAPHRIQSQIIMTEPTQTSAAPELEENKIVAERREKLRALREQGIAYPNDFRPTHHAAALQAEYAHTDKEALEANPLQVALAGRMMLKRVMGKASFATVQDGSGQIQFFITPADVGAEVYDAFKKWDLGDIVAAKGVLFRTNKGELSVRCTELRLLSKALRPLPDKFHGLADQEMRYRQRYVDLIVTPEARKTFVARTKAFTSIRKFMADGELHGSRNADAASDSRRRGGQAVRHAPQRARHADVPAHRAGALSEAADRRRLRARVRNQPEFP